MKTTLILFSIGFVLNTIFVFSKIVMLDYKIEQLNKQIVHLESVTFGSSRCVK